jgi:hypothetical protein
MTGKFEEGPEGDEGKKMATEGSRWAFVIKWADALRRP